jgi:(1->4)-alpha-D-glucan 1-alpha-D-glucosylmutase
VFRHIREGRIDGLRIDHIDGLADPLGYARALQAAVGPGFYVVVEKILEPGERLRPWPVAGTTGYDVLNQLDGILVDKERQGKVRRLYEWASGVDEPYGFQLRAAKAEILEISFASELEVLTSDLKEVADADRRTRDFTVNALRRALIEIIARFPTYRSYLPPELEEGEVEPEDVRLIEGAVAKAKRWSGLPDRSVHDFAADVLLGRIETTGAGRPDPRVVLRFRRRFQQLTGPVMAKSLEDTLFYRYGRLLALNEVGGDPGQFGIAVASFHEQNRARARAWPDALVATATHDTKRGEDARSRLLALSELPEAWDKALADWQGIARPFVAEADEGPQPDDNDQVLLLQALLGAWPLELLAPARGGSEAWAGFRERLGGFIVKALREAKRYTSWVNPDEDYERAAQELMRRIVVADGPFVRAFTPLLTRLAAIGMVNGLTRTVLKCTVPGVPDIYQGTEFWDLSLVDPDNRRPIDYPARLRALDALEEDSDAAALLADWRDGHIKQWLLARLLADRAAAPQLYADGDYHPLPATGAKARHCLAFRRSSGSHHRVVVVPRLVATLAADGALPVGTDVWSDTRLILPPGRWGDVLTGREAVPGPDGGIAVGELVQTLPIAVLRTIDEG